MNGIRSQRHPINFYLVLILSSAFYIAAGTLIIYNQLKDLGIADKTAKDYLSLVFAPLLFIFAIYSVVQYFKNVPTIKVNSTEILFGKSIFYWSDVKDIKLTGKQPFKYILRFPMEGAAIHLNDGTVKYIFDQSYVNAWQMKSFIQQVIIEKENEFSEEKISINNGRLDDELFEVYKDSQFTSFHGILTWVFTLFFCGMSLPIIVSGKPAAILFILIILVLFVSFSWKMNFFKLSDKYLLIKNHNFFWKKKVYRLEDIREIVFETRPKIPYCIRIITKDFKSNYYPAATIRDKTWIMFKKDLEAKGLKVRNELPLSE